MQKTVSNIIKNIAKKKGLPEEVVRAIIESQFQCAREAAKKGEPGNPSSFKNVRFKHLGILVAKPSRVLKVYQNGSNSKKNISE